MLRKIVHIILLSVIILATTTVLCSFYFRGIKLSNAIPEIDQNRDIKVLTAFFELGAMPLQSMLLYPLALGKNGMPVVFSQEIDPSTLDETDFEVITKNGNIFDVEFVTLNLPMKPMSSVRPYFLESMDLTLKFRQFS